MTARELIQKILIVTACTLAALLISPPRGFKHFPRRENVFPADSILRCYVTMDGSTKGTKGINGGMSAFLMRKYAQETRTPTKVVFSGFEALDCLLSGSADIVAVRMSDSLPPEGVFPTREIGDSIIITSGPFESFIGTVKEINSEKQKVKVIVSMFGRDTSVELDFVQVKRI